MHSGRGDRRHSEGGYLRLLYLLLHVLTHLLLWCHDSLHLAFKFQAPLHELVNLKEIKTKLSTIWRRFFRALVVSWGLLRAPAQERPRKSEGPTPRCTNITTIIFPRISKTANEAGTLYNEIRVWVLRERTFICGKCVWLKLYHVVNGIVQIQYNFDQKRLHTPFRIKFDTKFLCIIFIILNVQYLFYKIMIFIIWGPNRLRKVVETEPCIVFRRVFWFHYVVTKSWFIWLWLHYTVIY
jgi:hypothetical protein